MTVDEYFAELRKQIGAAITPKQQAALDRGELVRVRLGDVTYEIRRADADTGIPFRIT